MKKGITLLLALTLGFGAFAQSEPFIKALIKLEYGTTILDGAMLMKKDFPEFRQLTKAPVIITAFMNPYDETQKFNIEAFYFINDKDMEVIELYYVNNALYEKSAMWYFHKDSVAAVEKKYMKCNNTFISNPKLLAAEQGKVKFTEESYDLGKRTIFPVEKQGKNVREGETGYKLVYTPETGGRGIWVYMKVFSTMDNGLDISMNVPHVAPPNLIFSEIEAELVPGSKE
jgi:hypothetical protein